MPQGAYDPEELLKADEQQAHCPFKISSDHSITSIAWKNKEELKAVTSDGQVMHWSQKQPGEVQSLSTSAHNYYHTLDFSKDGGKKFVCAGYLPVLEIYDDETLAPVQFFDIVDRIGHTNKIYAAKFDETNHNVMYSGGWDRNVAIWDIRQGGKHCGAIYGPLISGDAIDVDSRSHLIATGSQKQDDGVQLWDVRTHKLLKTIKWSDSSSFSELSSIYSVSFVHPRHEVIIACGSNKNSAKLLDVKSGRVISDFADFITGLGKSPCIAVDSSADGSLCLIATADGHVHVKSLSGNAHPDSDDDD